MGSQGSSTLHRLLKEELLINNNKIRKEDEERKGKREEGGREGGGKRETSFQVQQSVQGLWSKPQQGPASVNQASHVY